MGQVVKRIQPYPERLPWLCRLGFHRRGPFVRWGMVLACAVHDCRRCGQEHTFHLKGDEWEAWKRMFG